MKIHNPIATLTNFAYVLLGWLLSALVFGQIASRFEKTDKQIVYDTIHGIWYVISAIGIFELIR